MIIKVYIYNYIYIYVYIWELRSRGDGGEMGGLGLFRGWGGGGEGLGFRVGVGRGGVDALSSWKALRCIRRYISCFLLRAMMRKTMTAHPLLFSEIVSVCVVAVSVAACQSLSSSFI